MKFAVLDSTGEDIRDPDSEEKIGSVVRTKIKVKIVLVQEHLSVGRTYERTSGTSGLFGGPSVADLFSYRPPRPRTLAIDEAVFRPLEESESYVKRGDAVREIQDDD
jgi:hypothetical protein